MHPRNLTWLELGEYIESNRGSLILPVGSVEGHGAHLPINTDTLIASFIADKLAERNGWISLPPITYTVAVPVRPGNVHIPPRVFSEYLRAVLEHFVSFGQKKFIIVMGHGGPDMKSSVVEACNPLCEKYNVLIAVFHVSQVLRDLRLVDTQLDRHAGMWETCIIMAIDDTLVKNLDLCRRCKELRKYGVVGEPLKASRDQGLRFIEAILNHSESLYASLKAPQCYYNWLK